MLSAGTKLGSYEILAPIGSGGMGEVYRARDAKLGREVAIKVLPASFASNAERMARFRREAKVLASLNHPNIASIYGVEDSGPSDALVMELAEGPTLADRIRQGPIPIEDALTIARQICDALEYAHEKGIIHRDLKPANIKVAPDDSVKILDFGLAKAVEGDTTTRVAGDSPTISEIASESGTLLGTAAYMAPEQAKGKPVDRRADIWAFGCVLYEMLTGQKAFPGETTAEMLAAVLKNELDWSHLPAGTPMHVRVLLKRCLQKDARQRLRDIGDARISLDEVLADAPEAAGLAVSQPAWRRMLPWAIAAALAITLAVLAFVHFLLQPKAQQPVARFTISAPDNAGLLSYTSLSPDGRKLAFVTALATTVRTQLWVRRLDSLTAQPLLGTEGAYWPFWSPDSRYLGFYAGGKLKKVSISGGPVQTLCNAGGRGATWNRDGTILFTNAGSLYRVPDSGGTPTLVAAPNAANQFVNYTHPQLLPDGRHYLFVGQTAGTAAYTAVGQLGSKETERLPEPYSSAIYASPGYLIYAEEGGLMARRFDAKRLQFTGQAVLVAENVGRVDLQDLSASQNGTLTYRAAAGSGQAEMAWFNLKGQKVGTVGQPGFYADPAISPDGTKLAVCLVEDPSAQTGDIWVYDLKRGTGARLTFSGNNTNPLWAADGRWIVFSSRRKGDMGIYRKPSDGLGSAEVVFQSRQPMYDDGLTPDGRYASLMTPEPAVSMWVLPLVGERKPFPFVQGDFQASRGTFSPNGQFVAYSSSETGRFEVYVQTFPQHLGKWQISTSGGDIPAWRGDGKELFYLSPGNEVMAVAVKTDSRTLQAGVPQTLFQAQLSPMGGRNNYALSPDGQRLLMLVPAGDAKPSPVTVVLNWPALLKK